MDNQPQYQPTQSSYQTPNKRLRTAIIISVIFGLLLAGFYGWQYIQNMGKTTVNITKLPSDTTITLNGEKIRSGRLHLEPGSYTLRGEREGYSSYERKLDITKDQKDIKAFFVLDPVSEEAQDEVRKNTRAYLELESEAGKYYEARSESTSSNFPIIENLPYRSPLYSIEYSLKGDDFKIQIKSSDPLGRQVAIERIQEFGYEPSDYVIEFLDLDNPFETSGASNE